MSEPPSKRPRVTPRTSAANEAGDNDAGMDDATPYNDLRQLAGSLARQPSHTPQRSASAGPGRTPGTAASQQQRTPRVNIRQFPVARRIGAPTTPHAIRALQARRDAALAASGGRRNRRRSGVTQRETPRDFLRALSRRLAATSQRVEPSPTVTEARSTRRFDDLDDGPDLPRPRLSMPLHDDDDSFHEPPPRLSMALEDVDVTVASVEGGRRAVSEDPRLRRSSLARLRLSERFGDDEELEALSEGAEGADYDGTVGPLVFEDRGGDEDILDDEMTNGFGDDTTQELRDMLASRRRSRHSDIDIPAGADVDDEPTFRFRMPQRSRDPSLLLPQPDDQEEEEDADAEQGADASDDEDAIAGAVAEDEEGDTEPDSENEEMEVDEAAAPQLRQPSISRSPSPSGKPQKKQPTRRKSLKVSRHGNAYPSLPASVVKRLATSFARLHSGPNTKLGKDTLDAISTASDWFFEQIGEDLASYAEHAGRKTIEESDVVTLMSRQRQISATTTPFSLAQKYLPRELLQDVRMPRPPPKSKRSTARKRRRTEMETIEEEAEE